MKSPLAFVPLLLAGCFYGSEFADDTLIKEAADICGATKYRVVREDEMDYLLVGSSREDRQAEACMSDTLRRKNITLLVRDETVGKEPLKNGSN